MHQRCGRRVGPGSKWFCEPCRSTHVTRTLRAKRARRAAVLAIYGNKCGCCGLDDVNALEFDHVDGYEGKRQQERDMRRVTEAGRPLPEFQVLCGSCHCVKNRGLTWKHLT